MNILIKELKATIKSLIIWCLAQVFIIYAGMMKYQGFSDSKVDVTALFSSFPKEMLVVFGIGTVDISKVAGFYSVFFLYFMLLAAIHATMLGAVIVSKEERDHCADFIYTKPIRRFQVIIPKLFAGVINILVFNMITLVASLFFIAQHNNGNSLFSKVSLTMLALFILQLFFLTLGTFLGSLLKNTKRATSLSATFIMVFFLISIAVDLYNKLDFLKYLTPFKSFNAANLMLDGQIAAPSAAILLLLSLIFTALTFIAFNQRDLAT